jgi:hypothetical protein
MNTSDLPEFNRNSIVLRVNTKRISQLSQIEVDSFDVSEISEEGTKFVVEQPSPSLKQRKRNSSMI